MKELLVVSALGADQPGIISQMAAIITAQNGSIEDTRMTVLGGEFALIMLISGTAECIDRIERNLPAQADALGLTYLFKRTRRREDGGSGRPYDVAVVGIDNPGIVHEIARFFHERAINIEEMHTETYAAAHTGTAMFSLSMAVNVPGATPIGHLKEELIDYCDARNLDASFEPHT
jgi:glycine cleavage system transcriptional repressor